MKYILVHWSETNNTSIMEEHCVKDVSLLKNSNKEGMIFHKEKGKKAPKGGWKAYLGRILSIHDSVKQARKSETNFLNEDKENSYEQLKQVSNKRKHFLSETESDESDKEYGSKPVLPVKERKKMAIISAENDIMKEMVSQVSPIESDDEVDELSRKELIAKVRTLQKKLDYEKSKQQLCNELPKMLVDAFGNKTVLEKLNKLSRYTSQQHKAAPKLTCMTSDLLAKPKSALAYQTPPKQIHLQSSGGGFTVAPSEKTLPESPIAPTHTCKAETPGTPMLQDYSQFDVSKVHSLLTPSAKAELERSKSFSKLTKTLVGTFFDRETLQKSTLAGKRKDGGHVLDAEKVDLIIGYVCKGYPFVTRSAVRNAISQKIKDEKEACKKKTIQ